MDFFLTIPTTLLQLLALVLLWNKRISIFLFLTFEVLHLGVLLSTGIFFWVWIIVNLGFLYLIKNLSKDSLTFLYQKEKFTISIIVILLSPLIFRPTILGWWDGTVNTIYDIQVITEDNKVKKLSNYDLSPYATVFAQNHLSYIDKNPRFSENFGFLLREIHPYTAGFLYLKNLFCDGCEERVLKHFKNDGYELYTALEKVKNIDEIRGLLHRYGTVNYNETKKKKLEMFLLQFFTNYNKKGLQNSTFKQYGAPYHLRDLSTKKALDGTKIKKVEIIRYNTWYNKGDYTILKFDKKLLMSIGIP